MKRFTLRSNSKNNLQGYLLYAFGEIFLIVVGILLAMYINKLNQDYQYRQKVKIADIPSLSLEELEEILQVPTRRARELYALADFQRIPTIGIRFAEDLIFIGYYSIHDLQEKDGATLTDEYEKKKGYKIDPCVEDQFRLAVHFAQTRDESKKWWDFTDERKAFRAEHGYPADRPKGNWHEVLGNN